MSLYLIANNFRFAIELVGAVALLAAAWLTFDTYSVSKEGKILARTVGFVLCSLSQVIAAVGAGSDVLLFLGFALYAAGLVCILAGFLAGKRLAMPAVLVIPPFAAYAGAFNGVSAALLFAIAYASYRQARREFNPAWRRFNYSFLLLGAGSAVATFSGGSSGAGLLTFAEFAFRLAGFTFLAAWVWQFLALRIRESLVILFISAALLLSTVVTLAFSTILISQITDQTKANLLTDARVLDLSIDKLKRESLAEAALLAADPRLGDAIASDDFSELQTVSEDFMERNNLGFVTVADAQGAVLIRAHALSKRGDSLAGERALEEALAGAPFVTVEASPVEKLSIRAGAPVTRKGKIVGAVIAGYPLDNAFVDGIKRVTGLDLFVYEGDTSVAATAFADDGRTRLAGIRAADAGVRSAVLSSGESVTERADIGGRPFLASYMPLVNGDGKIVGIISAAKPEQDILDVIDATNRLTLATVIIIMLALAYPIYAFTKRLTEGS